MRAWDRSMAFVLSLLGSRGACRKAEGVQSLPLAAAAGVWPPMTFVTQ